MTLRDLIQEQQRLRTTTPRSGPDRKPAESPPLSVGDGTSGSDQAAAALFNEDNSEIKIVPDRQRNPWLTEDQKRQPSPPSQAVIDEIMARRRRR